MTDDTPRVPVTAPGRLGTAGLVRRLLAAEVAGYRSIGRWLRRRPAVPADHEPVGYSQIVGPMLWLFVFGSAVEVPVVHVLLHRWPAVQWPVTVVGVWSLVWMIGLLAALRTHPHLLGPAHLRVRAGATVDVAVPYDEVVAVVTSERELPDSLKTVWAEEETDGVGVWYAVGVSGRTNVQLRLARPLAVPAPGLRAAGEVGATTIGLWADDPRALRRALEERLAAARRG
ncbi:hypothetical protein [Nocardioides alkalitolerans]|uniref:hypothetical protein n=1 Tax=Nocardioides alkalitolerans TaxID=281714 RepID=UPI00040373A4|nr:hypothetical protein [Nocardioides alkalitolerans]